MMAVDRRKELAELITKLSIHNAQVAANPKPYIDKAREELQEAIRCIDDVIETLTGSDVIFDFAIDNNMKPEHLEGKSLVRIDQALEVIKKYEQSKI